MTVCVAVFSDNFVNSGVLAFAMSIGNIFSSIALFKVRPFQVSDIKSIFTASSYTAARFVTLILSFMLCITYLSISTLDLNYFIASLLFMLFKADESFADVLHGVCQKHNRMDYIGKSEFLRGLATIIGFIATIIVLNNLLLSIFIMFMMCISVTIFYDFRNAALFENVFPVFHLRKIASLLKSCALPMLTSLCANSIVSLARQRYGIIAGQELLGIYASIATPAVLIQVSASYLYSPLYGTLADASAHSSLQFRRVFTKTLLMIAAVTTALIFLLSLIGTPLLVAVYGDTVLPYCYIFPYVLVATGVLGILFFINDVLIILRVKYSQLAINAIALAISIASFNYLISSFGINGVNLAIIGGSGIGTLLGIGFILRKRSVQSTDK